MIEFGAFAAFLVVVFWELIDGIRDPKQHEINRYYAYDKEHFFHTMTSWLFRGTVIGLACTVAWREAALGTLWLLLAIASGSVAAVALMIVACRVAMRIEVVDLTAPTEQRLTQLVKRRRVVKGAQFVLLLLWAYSWRHPT